jgi:O-methyltransferase involved in polyketide biosynthesis
MPALQQPGLDGIPETMLWTLHNRASESLRDDGILRDAHCNQIYRSLEYDFEGTFGKADGSHAMRSLYFDRLLQAFLNQHPTGVIVNLGEGLETQRFRIDGADALWLSVDVAEAIAIRERFITPDAQHRHIAASALDTAWMDEVPDGRAVYITAQGLFMYFQPQDVETLFKTLAERFPGGWLAFDHIPTWLSRKTLRGWKKTADYTTPEMPWGVDYRDVETVMLQWIPGFTDFHQAHYEIPRGPWRVLGKILSAVPATAARAPGITRLRLAKR